MVEIFCRQVKREFVMPADAGIHRHYLCWTAKKAGFRRAPEWRQKESICIRRIHKRSAL